VELRWVGMAAAARGSAVGVAEDHAALAEEAEVEELKGQLAVAALKVLHPGG